MTANWLNLPLKEKLILLLQVVDREELEQFVAPLGPTQLQELRDFLEKELLHLSREGKGPWQDREDIRSRYEAIPDYFYAQKCSLPIELCYNESCWQSQPACFQRKLKGQIEVALTLLKTLLSHGQ